MPLQKIINVFVLLALVTLGSAGAAAPITALFAYMPKSGTVRSIMSVAALAIAAGFAFDKSASPLEFVVAGLLVFYVLTRWMPRLTVLLEDQFGRCFRPLFLCSLLSYLAFAPRLDWRLAMHPLSTFGPLRWQLALGGFEIYTGAWLWFTMQILREDPFKPDPKGIYVVQISEGAKRTISTTILYLFMAGLVSSLCSFVLFLISDHVSGFDSVPLYSMLAAHISLVAATALFFFDLRFLQTAEKPRTALQATSLGNVVAED